MGIGLHAIQLTMNLYKEGYFKQKKSIIELGSQDIHCHQDHVVSSIKTEIPKFKESEDRVCPREFYEACGLDHYKSIDADGGGDFIFDLNKNILESYQYTKTFDVVTNHGTSEHCFDQFNVFNNIHNLCSVNGLMIHNLPFQGYLNHGFYNYQPNFFKDLAITNNYSIIGMYLNIDHKSGDLIPYNDQLMSYFSLNPTSTIGIVVVLKKNTSEKFKTPFDGKYRDLSLLPPEDMRVTFQYIPGPRLERGKDIHSMSIKRLIKLLFIRIIKKIF